MSYTDNYSWGTQGNKSLNSKRHEDPGLSKWKEFGTNTKISRQHQNAAVSSQLNYPQQQGNWNSPQNSALQINYTKEERNMSWNHPLQQPNYKQQGEQQKFQSQFGNDSEFFGGDLSLSFNTGQMNYNTANAEAPDPWNWEWEESSNISYRKNNIVLNDLSNNWDMQSTSQEQIMNVYNPIQNYFHQGGNLAPVQSVSVGMKNQSTTQDIRNEVNTQPNQIQFQEYLGQNYSGPQTFNNDRNNSVFFQVSPKPEVGNDASSLEFQSSDVELSFETKSEPALEDSGLSSEIKTERLSSDLNKIPLTTQALKDFCNEKYENGSVDVKSQNITEGLTPQWSVESQMSQETVSDDISPSIGESHCGIPGWDKQRNEASRESNLSTPSRGGTQKESKRQVFSLLDQGDEIKSFASKLKDHSEFSPQSIQSGGFQPPSPSPTGKSGDSFGNNPYSLGHKFSNKQNQAKNLYDKQIFDNISGNDYNNLVQQMGKCNMSDDSLNQQVIPGNLSAASVNSNQEPFKSNKWYEKGGNKGEELPNQETLPDNEERPEAEECGKLMRDPSKNFQQFSSDGSKSQPPRPLLPFTPGSENQEVALRPDRNQYLETGQLEDQMESNLVSNYNNLITESLPPFGLSRLVPGEIQLSSAGNTQSSAVDVSSPPPGLDRMVLGQITESESGTNPNIFRHSQSTPPLGLHRMVPGQLTDNQGQNIMEEPQNILSSNSRRDDIPPPGFHRMIPGESSSPETQNLIQIDPRERRVVTGVAKDEMNLMQTNVSSSLPSPANRLTNQPANPEESRLQFQSERCETIGSDNIVSYGTNAKDINSAKPSKGKERDRYREDISSDEAERETARRHERDTEYYNKKERNREREDSSGERYRDEGERKSKGRERVDWDRERRKTSSVCYREDKGRRREYRDDDRRRHKDYDYSDEDEDNEDTNGYYSDRARRSSSRYRDDYSKGYSKRDNRAKSLRSEKSKDSNEESSLNSSLPSYPLLRYFGQSRNSERFSRKNSWRSKLALSLPVDIRSAGKNRRHGGYSDRDRNLDRDREKDKDRERDRDRDKVKKDRDRGSDYYRRRDDIDDYSQRSRPSSRNDSVQDYKHRSGRSDYGEDREKEKGHYRGHSKRDRDMFYPTGYNYDPAYYTYYYQYYENLRRTNPIAYAEWFRKYYAQSQQGTFDGTYTEDRGSVHSGRSSANEENKERYIKTEAGLDYRYSCYQSLIADQSYPYRSHSSETGEQESGRRLDSSLQLESVQRLTPAKFTTAHVKGNLTPRGQLVKILARYPLDGQPATLEIHENLSCFDDLRKEFLNFPGPLVKGVTHKNNILRFCKQKIKDADSNAELFDKESYKLIWELLILLIRQNGTVVGTDISELLMNNRTAHVSRQRAPPSQPNSGEATNQVSLNEEKVTNQFRDYLIYGNTKEALEWAMKQGLWGHALFLASKMDQRTYANVMTRFANGLTMNDPLQTLYQLMSGRQPASVTCCADEKWGDWRPHLAMILSNSTARPDLDVKAVTTLGDTLGTRGNLHASHFCYLMAQVEFGTFAHKSSKIVLIGSSHILPFQQFANNEAIFATEIFEFACSLADPDFVFHHLQAYKLLIAKRLTEVGLVQEAIHYVEVIANTMAKFPAQYTQSFIQEVYDLGNMLKYFDPVYNSSEAAVKDPEWILQLLSILNDYQAGVLQHDGYGSVSNLTTYSENEGLQNLPLDPVTQETGNDTQAWQQQMYYGQHQQQQPQQELQQKWTQNDQADYGYQSTNNSGFLSVDQSVSSLPSADNSNRQYWDNQNQWMQPQGHPESVEQQPKETDYLSAVGVETSDSIQNHSLYNYYESNKNEKSPKSKPVSTPPFSIYESRRYYSAPKLTKQLSLSPGPSVKQTEKSLTCLKPFLLLPSRDKLIHSELFLNNSKTKHLVIPNPNYFMRMRERKESSSSNHTDNEDSNNEGSLSHVEQTIRFKARPREKKHFSQDVAFSLEHSKEAGECEINKAKKGRKSLSLWCLQKTDYKLTEKPDVLLNGPDLGDDNVFVTKTRLRSRRGSKIPLWEDLEYTDSEIYSPKINNKLLRRLGREKVWRNNTEIVTGLEKPLFWRHNSTETALLAVNSRKNLDATGRTLSKKLFMNLKLSLFGHGERTEKVGQRPIVFNGTFPIDMPLGGGTRNEIVVEKDVTDKIVSMSQVRTFEIDAPVDDSKVLTNLNLHTINPYSHKRIVNKKAMPFQTK